MAINYSVDAVGYGHGYNTYPLSFKFSSNYDMDSDDSSSEAITERVRAEIKQRGFTSYKVKSIKKA